MSIDYDKLNSAYAMLRTLREEFVKGNITKVELDAQEKVIRDDIRHILGFEPLVP